MPKTALQRQREFRARRKALKYGVTLHSALAAVESSTMNNVDNTSNRSTSNDASTRTKWTSIEVAISKDAAKSVSEGKIVIPAIKSFPGNSCCTSVSAIPEAQVCSEQPNLGKDLDLSVTSSMSSVKTNPSCSENKRKYMPTFKRIITPTVHQVQDKTKAKTQSFKLFCCKRPISDVVNNAQLVPCDDSISAKEFQDIHLPEIEKLVKNYQQGNSILRGLRPKNVRINSMNILDPANGYFQSILKQKNQIGIPPRPYPVAISMSHPAHQLPYQIVSPFQAKRTVPTIYYSSSQPMVRSVEVLSKNDETCGCSESMPVECILTEGQDSGEPASKKPALSHVIASSQTTSTLSTRDSSRVLENISQKQATKSSMMAQGDILHMKIRDAMIRNSDDEEEDCDKPLATLVGHPSDKILKQQICGIVENTNLQDITINGVIQKIFNMYPKFNLRYRKVFIKSTLRSLLYRLGEDETLKTSPLMKNSDTSISTSDPSDLLSNASPSSNFTSSVSPEEWTEKKKINHIE